MNRQKGKTTEWKTRLFSNSMYYVIAHVSKIEKPPLVEIGFTALFFFSSSDHFIHSFQMRRTKRIFFFLRLRSFSQKTVTWMIPRFQKHRFCSTWIKSRVVRHACDDWVQDKVICMYVVEKRWFHLYAIWNKTIKL